MRRLIVTVLFLLLPTAASAQLPWNECEKIAVKADQTKGPSVIFVGYMNGAPTPWEYNWPMKPLPPDTWNLVDLADASMWHGWNLNVPADAKAIFISGTLVSSGVPTPDYCAITMAYAALGSEYGNDVGNYQAAAVSPIPTGAFRENASMWVPLNDRKFSFFWHYLTASCPMIINMSLQAYCR